MSEENQSTSRYKGTFVASIEKKSINFSKLFFTFFSKKCFFKNTPHGLVIQCCTDSSESPT